MSDPIIIIKMPQTFPGFLILWWIISGKQTGHISGAPASTVTPQLVPGCFRLDTLGKEMQGSFFSMYHPADEEGKRILCLKGSKF